MKPRWITYNNREWRISELAREYNLPVGTLAARLERLSISRALATGVQTRQQAGRAGKARSPWTNPLFNKRNGAD